MKTNKKLKVRLSVCGESTNRARVYELLVVHVSLTLSADMMSADMILDSRMIWRQIQITVF